MAVCPRCQMNLKVVCKNHREMCSRTPLPKDLARMFLDQPHLTTTDFCNLYSTHFDTMQRRLAAGGIPIAVQLHRGYFLRSIKRDDAGENPVIPPGFKQCWRCGLLIPIEQPICEFCNLELSIVSNKLH